VADFIGDDDSQCSILPPSLSLSLLFSQSQDRSGRRITDGKAELEDADSDRYPFVAGGRVTRSRESSSKPSYRNSLACRPFRPIVGFSDQSVRPPLSSLLVRSDATYIRSGLVRAFPFPPSLTGTWFRGRATISDRGQGEENAFPRSFLSLADWPVDAGAPDKRGREQDRRVPRKKRSRGVRKVAQLRAAGNRTASATPV